jgi:hypothetical protein
MYPPRRHDRTYLCLSKIILIASLGAPLRSGTGFIEPRALLTLLELGARPSTGRGARGAADSRPSSEPGARGAIDTGHSTGVRGTLLTLDTELEKSLGAPLALGFRLGREQGLLLALEPVRSEELKALL